MPDCPENRQGGEIVEATPRTVCWARGSTSLVFQRVKNLPAMLETWVWSLGREDPLEKGMTTHSSVLAWRIPWTEEPGGLQSMGSQRVGHDWVTNTFTFTPFSRQFSSICWKMVVINIHIYSDQCKWFPLRVMQCLTCTTVHGSSGGDIH